MSRKKKNRDWEIITGRVNLPSADAARRRLLQSSLKQRKTASRTSATQKLMFGHAVANFLGFRATRVFRD